MIWAKLPSCSRFKRPDVPSEAPLPPTLRREMSPESAYFLFRGPPTCSLLTLSPHKCVTSSTTFLFKKMFCPPWRCRRIWEMPNPSQNKGIGLLTHLTSRGSRAPGPRMLPGASRGVPFPQDIQTRPAVLNPGGAADYKTHEAQVPLWTNRVRTPQAGPGRHECLKPPHASDVKPESKSTGIIVKSTSSHLALDPGSTKEHWKVPLLHAGSEPVPSASLGAC